MNRNINCDVAVIGSGPSGLGAAIALRQAGVDRVVVLEREQMAGGAVRHCGSSPFGMIDFHRVEFGPTYARHLTRLATAAGVDLRLGHTVTRLGAGGALDIVTPHGPATLQATRVILATGARETPRSARLVSGMRPVGVLNTGALQSMVYLKGMIPFRRPVIVGSELVSFSALTTCLRHGIHPVAMVEQDGRPTTYRPAAMMPRLLRVPFLLKTRIEEILGVDKVEGVRVRDCKGSRVLACDGVLFTGRFQPEAALLPGSVVARDPLSGGPVIDQLGRCSDGVYFAAGNLLRPVETGGWSWREGRAVGLSVAQDLQAPVAATRSVAVVCGPNLKYVVPQRLSLPLSDGMTHLQIRVASPQRGTLVVSADGRRLWNRRVCLLPERRCLIALDQLHLPEDVQTIQVQIEDKK